MFQFDSQTPSQRIEQWEGFRPSNPLRMAWSHATSLGAMTLFAYAIFNGGAVLQVGVSAAQVLKGILTAPMLLKSPFVGSAFMYASTFLKAPNMLDASEVKLIPNSWKVPIGVNKRRKTIYHDFNKIPHALVTGTTGGGKTVLLNAILYMLMKTHGPGELEIYIIDMKGGASFAHFETLPHIQEVISDTETAKSVLGSITETMFKRLEHIREDRKYLKQPRRFKRILVVIDEGAELSSAFAVTPEEIEIRKHCMAFMSSLARIGREPCVNLLYATQRPSNEALPVAIRELMDAKFAFRQGERSSKLTLGNDNEAAAHLPAVKGRMIYSNCGHEEEVQGVYVRDEVLYEWIRSYGLIQDVEDVPDKEYTNSTTPGYANTNEPSVDKEFVKRVIVNSLSTPEITAEWKPK